MYINNHDSQEKKKRRINKGHTQISGKADIPSHHRTDSKEHQNKLGLSKFLPQEIEG